MSEILARIADRFSPARIGEFLAGFVPDLILAAVTFAAFWFLWRFLATGARALTSKAGIDRTAQAFVQSTLKYSVLTVGAISALGQLGINTGSVIASLGIAGLTIGFAARDALSNVISGVFIFWDRPFVLGDLVEIDGKYGRVEAITLRSTRVVTPDGRMLAIPNSEAVNKTVSSYTNFPHLRLDIGVTVGVEEDLGRVRQVLLEQVRDDARFMAEPAPVVVTTALNDYNVALELRAWLDNERDHVAVRCELRERAFEALRTAAVDMPYETLQLRPVEIRNQATA